MATTSIHGRSTEPMTDISKLPLSELKHYGVLGMKWGRTKADGDSAVPNSSDYDDVAALRKKQLSSMSNVELKKLNARTELEAKYKKHKGKNPALQTVKTGKDIVTGGIAAAGLVTSVIAVSKQPWFQEGVRLAKIYKAGNIGQLSIVA